MILVTGATGQLGRATLQFLMAQKPTETVAALVRDKSKAADLAALGVELREGSYDDYASLLQAFRGVDKLLFISANDIPNRHTQQANVVNAAKEAGVKHVFYTSFHYKTDDGSSPISFIADTHIETERQLKRSGLTYTILKNAVYMDMLPIFLGENVLTQGIYFPGGEGKASYTLRTDLAEATANLLLQTGHENREYIFSGPDSYTLHDVARAIGEVTGQNVGYASPSHDEFVDTMQKAGAPAEAIAMFGGFGLATQQGELDFPGTELEKILGRKVTPLKTYLQTVYAKQTA